MRAWIFQRVDHVSDNYHEGGGLLVIAEDEAGARSLLIDTPDVEADPVDADVVYDLAGEPQPRVWIFPDAGCC